MARFDPKRHRTVLAVTRLRTVPSQHGHVGRRHQQQPAVSDRLHGSFQKPRRTAVRIQIDHVELLGSVPMPVHKHSAKTKEVLGGPIIALLQKVY